MTLILLLINAGKPYVKSELMSMSDEQRVNSILDTMQKNLDKAKQDTDKPTFHNFKSYLYNDNNKAFHLEIIKRTFLSKRPPKYILPEDFQPVVAEYFQLCYEYNKLPTLSRPRFICSYPY